MIRPAVPADTPALLAIAVATGLFQPDEADALLRQTLDDLHAGALGPGHYAYAWIDDASGEPRGWVYFAENAKSNHAWDLWWIGVDPSTHDRGIGTALLAFVEDFARAAAGRLLIIETSSLAPLARTRAFYARRGYAECGRVPDFYGDGDAKVIFARTLRA